MKTLLIQLLNAWLHFRNNVFPTPASIEEILGQPLLLNPHTKLGAPTGVGFLYEARLHIVSLQSREHLYRVGNLAMWSRPLGVSRTLEYTQQGIQVRTSSYTEQDIRSRTLEYTEQSFGSRATNYTEQGIQSKSSRQYTGLVHAAIQSRQPRQLYLILDSSKKLKHIYYSMKLQN